MTNRASVKGTSALRSRWRVWSIRIGCEKRVALESLRRSMTIAQTNQLLSNERSDFLWILQAASDGQLSVLRWEGLKECMHCIGISMRQGKIRIAGIELQRMTGLAIRGKADSLHEATFFVDDVT
jgi:hypothetical protein